MVAPRGRRKKVKIPCLSMTYRPRVMQCCRLANSVSDHVNPRFVPRDAKNAGGGGILRAATARGLRGSAQMPACSAGGRVTQQEPAALQIVPVTTKRELDDFIRCPRDLYRDDPAWIAPLEVEQRTRFAADSHYASHARWRAWLARDSGGRVLGRITAQIDSLEPQAGLAYFGMLEAASETVLEALVAAASAWLRENGMQRVRGPLNLHINEEVGLLVAGFDTPPCVMMGHARPWYGDALARLGFEGVRDLLAYRIRPDFEAPRVMTRLARHAAPRVTVR